MKMTLFLFIAMLVFWLSACAVAKPNIVEVSACRDLCTGPESEYMIRVYEDVNDVETCRKFGGKPHTFTGWSTEFVCIVPGAGDSQLPWPMPREPKGC